MRDALEFEWLGIPSVAIIADALTGPADAMRRLSGMSDYPYVTTKFPVGALDAPGVRARARRHADEVFALLTDRPAPAVLPTLSAAQPADATDLPTLRFADEDEAQQEFATRGWTDGNVVVIPTVARVERLLASTDREADEIMVRLDTRDGLDATVAQIAVNAVMAGVDAALFPVVLAALDAIASPRFNLHAHTATMAGAQQVLVIRGPVTHRLGFRTEDGALGPGWPANNRVGRAVRLVIRNLLRSVHGEFDRAGFSHPGRFGWCIGEDPRSPWPLGDPDTSEVLAYASVWQGSIINHEQTAEPLLDDLALVARTGCHSNWLHHDAASESTFYATRPFLFVAGHEHAEVLVRDGYRDLGTLREALFRRLTDRHPALRPVAIASADNIHVLYVHATGMQQTWFFAPFQSHALARREIGQRASAVT